MCLSDRNHHVANTRRQAAINILNTSQWDEDKWIVLLHMSVCIRKRKRFIVPLFRVFAGSMRNWGSVMAASYFYLVSTNLHC